MFALIELLAPLSERISLAELEELALDPLVSPVVVLGGEPPMSAVISLLTGGRPARCG
jgi:hypothetical protein